jgi:hypothetical protein
VQLATSFDGFCIFRPFEYNETWTTDPGSWYHIDQDVSTKPDKICVQGFLNYYDSGEVCAHSLPTTSAWRAWR